ncbi:MAG: DedA family protein [Thermovenabulum sp.]|uniref:DedA family protein n=1 Tax=Thermovenabulum sp. TaxID=3100335 RepID=UPI003C79DFAC
MLSLYDLVVKYGYAGIFIFLLYEGTGMPGPVQIVFLASAYLIKKGKLNLIKVVFYATLGNLCGNILAYVIGKYKGKYFVKYLLNKLKIKEEMYLKIEDWYKKKGGFVVFISRLIGIPRTPAIWASGIVGIDIKSYIFFSILGDLVWAAFWTVFTYYGINFLYLVKKLGFKI